MSLDPLLSALDALVPAGKSRPSKKATLKPIHPELAQLWNWGRAGEVLGHQKLSTVAEERGEWFWSQVWLSPAEALSAQKALRKVPGFSETLVPFATDEAGNYTCHDAKSGALIDWDHETRKQRKLKDSLPKIFTLVAKLLKQESKPAPERTRAAAPVEGTLPSAIRAVKSAALRKHAASHKLHGFNGAALSGDGALVAGQVYGTRAACFAELTKDQDLIPSEPGFVAQKKEMGFVSLSTGGFAFDGEQLVWRMGEQLSIWSWREGALGLDGGAKWTKADPNFMDRPLRFRAGRVAVAAIVDDKVQIALWAIDQLPQVKALAEIQKELGPSTLITVGPWEGGQLHFDLDQNGTVTTLESPEYQVALISRWDGQSGKQIAQTKLKDFDAIDLTVSPDGNRVVVVSREGQLVCFDAKLAETARVKKIVKGKCYATGARFDPSGAFLISSSLELGGKGGDLALWNPEKWKELARSPVKDAAQGFQVRDVARTGLVTTSPLSFFELR